MRKAQVWAVDAILAVVVIVIAIIGFFVFSTGTIQSRSNTVLEEESSVLSDALGASAAGGNLTLLKDVLDERRIVELSTKPYWQVKQELGLTTDFCIYFTDRNGNLLEIGGVRFLGSPDINVSVGGKRYACNNTELK